MIIGTSYLFGRWSICRLFAIAAFIALLLPPQVVRSESERIVVLVDEQVRGVHNQSGSWMDPGTAEEALVALLREAGYEVKDPQAVRANLLREQAVLALAGDTRAIAAAGTALDAEYLVTGKAFAKSAGQVAGSSMKSLQANVQLSLMDTRRAALLTTATGQAAKPHVDEVMGGAAAIKEATTVAGRKLVEALTKRTEVVVPVEPTLHISISGLKSYRHFLVLKAWVEQSDRGWKKTAVETYTTGSADLQIETSASGPDFAKAIAAATFDGFVVNPVDVQAGQVTLKVITP